MSSNLRVNNILPSVGTNVAIGTAGGSVTLTGTLNGNINVTGLSTFSGGINVGSSFVQNNAVGLGSTTTTGRNAGVGTAVGTIIYNSTTNGVEVYTGNTYGWVNIKATGPIKATGGTITQVFNKTIHTFTASGSFNVSDPTLTSIEYLVVGGGGSGGFGPGLGDVS